MFSHENDKNKQNLHGDRYNGAKFMTGFQSHTLEQQTDAMVRYMPSDKLFAAKNFNGTNLRKLLLGINGEFVRIDQIFQSVWDGTNILTTTDPDYMAAWEGAVGIPNSYFPQTSSLTIEQRRQQVLIQLRSLGVLTEQDFIDLAALLGETITIEHPVSMLYPPYIPPFIPYGDAREARFIMIVKGPNLDPGSYPPYSVPFIPTNPVSQIQVLFDILKPANTIIIYLNS